MISFMEKECIFGPDGSQYEGQYRDGKRHGSGKLMLENGEIFIGEHKFGKRDGRNPYLFG